MAGDVSQITGSRYHLNENFDKIYHLKTGNYVGSHASENLLDLLVKSTHCNYGQLQDDAPGNNL